MDRLNNIPTLAQEFYNTHDIVRINIEEIMDLDFSKHEVKVPEFSSDLSPFNTFVFYTVVNAINYCYWQGSYSFRPNGMDSQATMQLLLKEFQHYNEALTLGPFADIIWEDIHKSINVALRKSGITLIEERTTHINEIFDNINILEQYFMSNRDNLDAVDIVNFLVENFDTYASDIFLKRAQLMPALLNREPNVVISNLNKLHIPIDYQVPKMLERWDILDYDTELEDKIFNNEIIPKNSLEEMSIRSASVIATEMIMKEHNLSPLELDYILIMEAKDSKGYHHHLTLTTEY